MPVTPPHETLSNRLAEVLLRLYRGERLSRSQLADEYGVSERTIYRDLNRLGEVVEIDQQGFYQLASVYQGNLCSRDVEILTRLTGLNQIFPHANHQSWAALINQLTSYLIKPHHQELAVDNCELFQALEQAIQNRKLCLCTYKGKRRTLAPYRLVNQRGLWYLAATENSVLKAFSLSRLEKLTLSDDAFDRDDAILVRIEEEDDIWYSEEKFTVELLISPTMAHYFRRRAILPNQQVVGTTESGWLKVTSQVSHSRQILATVRFWLPDVKIQSPASLREELHAELREYLAD